MLTFYVPPGIGDFSAMYSKLCNTGREITIRSSYDQPHRLGPFLDLLPKINNGGYSVHGANTSLAQTLMAGTDLRSLPDGDYFLAINQWLEEGNRVEDWIPGETTFHYEMNIPEADKQLAAAELAPYFKDSPKVGVYTSAYGNSRHWGFWDWTLWKQFLVYINLPRNTHYIFIGAEYDLAISENVYDWMIHNGYAASYLVGKLEIGGTIEIMRNLDYFFSFPSGLGFLADVVNTPNTMWFPLLLTKMRYTFADPVNIDTGKTLHNLFSGPEEAAEDFRKTGLSQFNYSVEKKGRKYASNPDK
jgi:ADP-heptose:LPS heptosyltransferase